MAAVKVVEDCEEEQRRRRARSAMAFRRSESNLVGLMSNSSQQQGGEAAHSVIGQPLETLTQPKRSGSILVAKDTVLQHQAQEIEDLKKSSSKSLARAWAKIREQENLIQKLRNKISLIEAESDLLRQKLDLRKQKQQELSTWMKMSGRNSNSSDFDGQYTSKHHKMFKTDNYDDIPIWQQLYFRFRECQTKSPSPAAAEETRVSPMWILFERALSRQMEADDFILAMNMLYSQFQQSARNSSLVELYNQISCLNKVMTCMSSMLEIPGSIMDLPLLTSRMLEIAMDLCAARSGRILFLEGDHLVVMAALSKSKQDGYVDIGVNNRPLPIDGIVGKVLKQGKTLNYKMGNDLAADFNKTTDVIMGQETTPFVCSPILDADGSLLGCLQLFDHMTEKKLQEGDRILNFFNKELQVNRVTCASNAESDRSCIMQILCEEFARVCGKEFEQCRAFSASWRAQQLLQRFLRFTKIVSNSSDFVSVLKMLNDMTVNVISVDQCGIFYLDKVANEFRLLHTLFDDESITLGLEQRVPNDGIGLISLAAQTAMMNTTNDVGKESKYSATRDLRGTTDLPARGICTVPLKNMYGEVSCVFQVSKHSVPWTRADEDVISTMDRSEQLLASTSVTRRSRTIRHTKSVQRRNSSTSITGMIKDFQRSMQVESLRLLVIKQPDENPEAPADSSKAKSTLVTLVSAGRESGMSRTASMEQAREAPPSIEHFVGEGITGHVAETTQCVRSNDAFAHPFFSPTFDRVFPSQVCTNICCVPVISEEDATTIAVLEALNKTPCFSEEDEIVLKVFAKQIGVFLMDRVIDMEGLSNLIF
ncbi:hypothetical protein GUITHDRAFT_113750 [Guillardia theta CCMP2712]|uniref:GAF domain-containing protein n=1 Tax=Guillardia theta (strain CCMP2712) TaxID=905079 RepID=L1IVK9_GUITC|nr:hypothetical protein GUITHDRAFT_113750 [Guillardia theta CCMP2712]EKX40273.1 hypothetical protein GUITHDRAFT_113750 [Guillardia theta CCMP2712]|eukprot:XP_005827253.1 hypothetical protein GUITHDRAFT_113750 [Guillardia theta CCMP2712]